MDSDSEWRERGVEFKLVDEAMIPSVIELLDDSFFPDEPLFRCHFSILIIGITKPLIKPLLAPTGALIVIACYCISSSSRGHFLRFLAFLPIYI